MKYVLSLIILVHGLIHLIGFIKAFALGNITQLTKEIDKTAGFLWLTTSILFLVGAMVLLLQKSYWPIMIFIAVIISQVLIILVWKDAKFGSILNFLLLMSAIIGWSDHIFESRFERDVKMQLAELGEIQTDLLIEEDIEPLPTPVKNYIRYSGSLNQPKVKNARIVFDGEMRGKKNDRFKFSSLQYNFIMKPSRHFFMKAKMFGVSVLGYHEYQNEMASMDIRLLGLIPVSQASGLEMNKAETVTFFNEICILIPAALVDKRIEWESIDDISAKATFTNGENTISAILYFNQQGQLINFISDNRYDVNEMKQFRFSTPLGNYRLIGGRYLATYGEAIWHQPDGEFTYGKFYLKDIEYNVTLLQGSDNIGL
jgi:hypothetical protein